MMKKYLTNDLFDKAAYVAALAHIGVDAEATEDGVLINMEQYKANYRASEVPHLVYMNHRWVKALY